MRIRTHALVSGFDEEPARARLACAHRMDLDPLRKRLEPAHTATIPTGLDPCLPKDVADVYDLANDPHRTQQTPSLNVGPYAIPGSANAPIATGNASYRQVIDVGRWDDSKIINNPGQSGDPASPHYRDLAGMSSTGRYFPMLYSRAAVERNTERRIVLTP